MISRSLVARYAELKREAPDCLLLMQVGAFMNVLNDDARAVARVTGLKLKMAGDMEAPVVTGGFPRSGLDTYIGRLVRAVPARRRRRRVTKPGSGAPPGPTEVAAGA